MFGAIMKKTHIQSKIIYAGSGTIEVNNLLGSADSCMYNGRDVVVLQVMPIQFEESRGTCDKRGYLFEFVYKKDFDSPNFKELYM